MLTATALVLFMTIPGLALFYAGRVRSKNVLSVLTQCFAITGLMTVIWSIYGYSRAFEDGGALQQWVGGLSKAFLSGVGVDVSIYCFEESLCLKKRSQSYSPVARVRVFIR